MNTVEKNVNSTKTERNLYLFVFSLFALTVVLAFNPWLDGFIRIVGAIALPAILIFNYWRTKSELSAWMLLMAGVFLGQALNSLGEIGIEIIRWMNS